MSYNNSSLMMQVYKERQRKMTRFGLTVMFETCVSNSVRAGKRH